MTTWRFPKNDGGEQRGINANYDAKFRGARIPSLAREICQNSLDARTNSPVRIEFSSFTISVEQFPERNSYKKYLNDCFDYWTKRGQSNEIKAFQRALNCFKNSKIRFLRISDHNTTGVRPSEGEWDQLIRSSGSSNKADDAGGSYGLGKAAPFACSDMTTVFYSTYTVNKEKYHQGVAHFATFEDSAGQEYQNVGYYCEGKNAPIQGELFMDPSFHRDLDDFGTDIYIAGYTFADEDDWAVKLLASVLDNFFYAVFNGSLEVEANGQLLTQKTLPDFIQKNKERLDKQDLYYNILTKGEPDVHHKTMDFQGLGNIDIWIIENDLNCHRKVKMIRKNGMAICDWNRFKNVPFAGICWISGTELNKRLRKMENPEHTDWKDDYLDTPEERDEAKKLLKDLWREIKNYIVDIFQTTTTKELDAAGAGSLLPDELPTSFEQQKYDAERQQTRTAKNVTTITVTSKEDLVIFPSGDKTVNESKLESGDPADEGGSQSGNVGRVDRNPDLDIQTAFDFYSKNESEQSTAPVQQQVTTAQQGDMRTEKLVLIKLNRFRSICTNPARGNYRMITTPSTDGKDAELVVMYSAETESLPAQIRQAYCAEKELIVDRNHIRGFDFVKGQKLILDVVLNTDSYCSIEVKAYASES